ncbi:hypothetical protein pb186bvf_004625 [Paramecium bursaria]
MKQDWLSKSIKIIQIQKKKNQKQNLVYVFMDEDDSYQRRKRVKVDLIDMIKMQSPVLSPGKVRWECDSYDASNELQQIEKQKKQFELLNDDFLLLDSPKHGKLIKQESFQNFSGYVHQDFESQFIQTPWDALYEQVSSEREQVPIIKKVDVEDGKKKKKFKNKNFCRYIILSAFRTLEKELYQNSIKDICREFSVDFEKFKTYYIKQRPVIMGYQLLRQELIANDISYEVNQRKKAFKQFMIFYLDRIATKDILSSKKGDTKEYMLYKNIVLTYYVNNPEIWQGNAPEWQNFR